MRILLIGLGSCGGGIIRYLLSTWLNTKSGSGLPWGTWLVNIVGCFLIGLVFACFERGKINYESRMFLMTGFLGGFTTFSAFSHETLVLIRNGQIINALSYVLLSVVLGLLATAAGYYVFSDI